MLRKLTLGALAAATALTALPAAADAQYYGGYYGRPYGYYAPVRVAVRRHYHLRHGHRYVCTRLHRHYY